MNVKPGPMEKNKKTKTNGSPKLNRMEGDSASAIGLPESTLLLKCHFAFGRLWELITVITAETARIVIIITAVYSQID